LFFHQRQILFSTFGSVLDGTTADGGGSSQSVAAWFGRP